MASQQETEYKSPAFTGAPSTNTRGNCLCIESNEIESSQGMFAEAISLKEPVQTRILGNKPERCRSHCSSLKLNPDRACSPGTRRSSGSLDSTEGSGLQSVQSECWRRWPGAQ
mmetsp:Transcript_23445/g.51435  ORF Transcript_23445/g.51435 Transcript_23445/m.51435 type:complete len:113 (+) Transcript_23445:63-401(+)